MTEADEKRLAIIRKAIADGPGYAGACEPDRAFLLRLLDERVAEMERLERSVTRAEAELQRLSFAAGNVALDHPDWPPEYARHLAALVVRAEAAEKRARELEEALRPFANVIQNPRWGWTRGALQRLHALGREPFEKARAILTHKKERPV